uniref:Uncharacterized protein n=1 Tax=Romanomermis culicivorax TaxID=13658 RepID=A0A915KJ19_ROMCU
MSIDSSKGVIASDEMSSSVSLRNSLICVAETIRSAAGHLLGDSAGAAVGSLAMLRSKISVSWSSSWEGSGAVSNIGCLSNSSPVSKCAEAIVGNDAFGAIRSFGWVEHVNVFISQKPLGWVPKQKDQPWSDNVQWYIENLYAERTSS